MKIAHLDTEISWRGGEQQILYLAEALKAAGDENLIMARSHSALESRMKERGFECFCVSPWTEWGLIAARSLRRRLVGGRFDILHAHTAHAAALGALAVLGTRIPLVVSRRVDFHLSKNPLSRWKYLRAAKILAVSSAVKNILIQDGLPSERIELVYDGVDLKRFEGERIDRQALGLPNSKILIGQIAALSDQKDPLTFIRAMECLDKKGVDFRAVMVGDGPLKEEVEREIARLNLTDRVLCLGFREDAFQILRHLDVFVLSSRFEGLGTSILDAFAAGIPVIATKTGGIPEAVEDGVSGLLVPPRDARALSQAIEGLIQNPSRRDLLRQGGLESVKRFTAQAMVEKTIAIYHKIC